jgi:hypothetical protein
MLCDKSCRQTLNDQQFSLPDLLSTDTLIHQHVVERALKKERGETFPGSFHLTRLLIGATD